MRTGRKEIYARQGNARPVSKGGRRIEVNGREFMEHANKPSGGGAKMSP